MKDIQKFISPFIEGQFPSHYLQRPGIEVTESERAVIVDFMEAFYEYLEENRYNAFYESRRMSEYRDVDTTLTEFIQFFRTKYLNDLPYDFVPTDEFAIKKIIDLYRAKGSEKAVKLLVKLLFNTNVDVYLPGQDVLRPSDSEWKEPRYLELTRTSRNIEFLFTRVTGNISGTSAFVESVVTKRVNGKLIDILYISDIRGGDFQTGEFITDNGRTVNAPKLIGSLTSVEVLSSNPGYSIGDRVDIISNNGVNGVAKVSKVFAASDSVDFELTDSGYGYSLEDTQVFVSDAMLFVSNENLEFQQYEIVTQSLFQFQITDTSNVNIDDTVVGRDASNNEIGQGHVVNVESNSIVVETANGSFEKFQTIELQSNNIFIDNEDIKQESEFELLVSNTSGSFTVGETVLQRETANGVYTNIAYGTFTGVSNNVFTVETAWGDFQADKSIEGLTSGETADIVEVTVTANGALGSIISTNGNIIEVSTEYGNFTANSEIRGEKSKNRNAISTVEDTAVDVIAINGIDYSITSYEDKSASGIVVDQLNNRIGVFGNTNPYYFTANSENTVTTENGLTKEILRVGKGSGADFEIASLVDSTTETIEINSDIIGQNNVAGLPYTGIVIESADNSGVGRVANTVTVSDGGSGYSNNDQISFSGGGYLNGDPIISAVATIVTDSNGAITDVNVLDSGQGYFLLPSYTIPSGSSANLVFEIETGYGFPKSPYSGFDAVIDDVLSTDTMTIGEIFSLKNVSRGSGYDAVPFVKIVNTPIADYFIRDVRVNFTQGVGTFILNEIITAPSGAKGRIKTLGEDSMTIRNLSFENRFAVNDTITGATTLSTANITSISELGDQPAMGNNADVAAAVNFEQGLISEVALIDSGYGYIDGESITFRDKGTTVNAGTGIASVQRQGIAEGFWKTRTSHLNEKFLHDNRFYQEYSYQVQAGVSFDNYEQIIKDTIHVAGTELFGETHVSANVTVSYTFDSEIETDL